VQFANQVQNEMMVDFVGTVAGGLNKNQQVDVFQPLCRCCGLAEQTASFDTQQFAAGNVARRFQPGALPLRPRRN